MRSNCLLIGLVLLGAITACGTSPSASTPELESTKLHDVVSSEVLRVALDPRGGPITRFPVITDNENSVSQTLIQRTTDGPGRELDLVDALKRAKAQGAHLYSAACTLSPKQIVIIGSAEIPSSYPGISIWNTSFGFSEALARTYVPDKGAHPTPTHITANKFEIRVEMWLQGGSQPLPPSHPTPPGSTTCSKAIMSLLD
jgi:hypothetical protein